MITIAKLVFLYFSWSMAWVLGSLASDHAADIKHNKVKVITVITIGTVSGLLAVFL